MSRRPRSTVQPALPGGQLAAALLLGLLPCVAHAGPVVGGSESIAMGGTTRASVRATGSVISAPAVLALRGRYELQGAGLIGPDKMLGVRAYAMDSNTGPIALGLGYQYEHSVPETNDADLPGWTVPDDDLTNESAETVLGGGLSTSFAERRFAVGLGLAWHQQATRFTAAERWLQGGLSIAGRLGPEEELILSGVVENMINPGHEETPLTFATGLTWRPVPAIAVAGQLDVLTGLFDGPAELGFGTGVEGLLAEVIALRAGFNRDPDRDTDYVTMGIGAFSEAASLDYAAELGVGHVGVIPPGWEDGKMRHQHTLSLLLKL